ncbi:hypothetical protein PLICRDRAFT_552731 [Plicaturopsis crispa FD-325 SS-3]|nr:hypothetical protein PLICRDRAFT_552731 [Plicaturopsis crispa FD-325 SS-3]
MLFAVRLGEAAAPTLKAPHSAANLSFSMTSSTLLESSPSWKNAETPSAMIPSTPDLVPFQGQLESLPASAPISPGMRMVWTRTRATQGPSLRGEGTLPSKTASCRFIMALPAACCRFHYSDPVTSLSLLWKVIHRNNTSLLRNCWSA